MVTDEQNRKPKSFKEKKDNKIFLKIFLGISILTNVVILSIWMIFGGINNFDAQKDEVNANDDVVNSKDENLSNINDKSINDVEDTNDENDFINENELIEEDDLISKIKKEIAQHYLKTDEPTEELEIFIAEYFDYFENMNMEEEDFYSLFEDDKLVRIKIEIEFVLSKNNSNENSSYDSIVKEVKYYLLLGVLQKYLDDYEVAIKTLLIAEKLANTIDDMIAKQAILLELGICNFYIYDFTNSILYFSRLINTDESFYLGYYWRGYSYLYSDNIEDAMKDFSIMFKLENQQNDINLNQYERTCISMSKLFKLKAKIGKAIEYAEKSTDYIESNLESIIYIIKLYMQIDNYSKANSYLEKAKSIDKNDEDVILMQAILLREEHKEYQKALTIINQLLYTNPDNYLAYNERGKIFTNLQLYDSAFNDFNTAIKIEPMYANAYGNRGWIFYKYKNMAEKHLLIIIMQ